ncbi:MAG: DEAD/DEAH box helicase family protein [Acidobacteria bacterium]|nr:DEAD/DEAH box helicase family protein [Acidobacteriota bacterium]
MRRFEKGLRHFEHVPVDEVPTPLVFYAADASLAAGEFDRGETLARELLRRLGRGREAEPHRAAVKVLIEQCRKGRRAAARAKRAAETGQADLYGPGTRVVEVASRATKPGALAKVTRGFARGRPMPKPMGTQDRPAIVGGANPAATPLVTPPTGDGPGVAPARPAVAIAALPEPTIPPISMTVEFDPAFLPSLPEVSPPPSREALLWREYAIVRLQRDFDELISLSDVQDVEHFWYQLETVRRILRDFRGRVLLADEVGLGKTIEACLALKEYWVRGLVRRALILTPSSLVGQWVEELSAKFRLEAAAAEPGRHTGNGDGFWTRHPIIVASLPLARQAANRAILSRIDYDLVVVDEAHRLKRRSTAAWQLVNDLKKRFLFLLSATPVGNHLTELYNLILLLRPGVLSTETRFRREYGRLDALQEPARREKLRALLREVMVRNTRAHIDLRLPRRLAATVVVQPSDEEAAYLDDVSAWIRERYMGAGTMDRVALMTLQQQAGSSGAALAQGLQRAGADGEWIRRARRVPGRVGMAAKPTALVDLLQRSNEKAIVFTRFLATLEEVQTALEEAGFATAIFHGGLSGAEKDHAIAAFASGARVLVSTDVGAEGRNLQFCRTVINYDLPWNPASIEQRVGRVHRIGQTRDVYVFNLCLRGSIEEQILRVLHEKINLFELVAGEMEMILGELDEEQDFASLVMDLWVSSAAAGDPEQAFNALSERLAAARQRYRDTRALDQAVFREDYEV